MIRKTNSHAREIGAGVDWDEEALVGGVGGFRRGDRRFEIRESGEGHARDDGRGVLGADFYFWRECQGLGRSAIEVIRVDLIGRRRLEAGAEGPERHGFVGDGAGDGDFVDTVFSERDADGIA